MKKIITFLFFLSLFSSDTCFSQSGWFWQNPLPTGNDMEKIRFVNDSVGYGVGWGSTVIKTTNGGSNWFLANNGIRQLIATPGHWNGIITSLCFLNEETGYVCGTKILKTTNGGNNWLLVNAPNYYYYEIYFKNVNTGIAVSNSLIKTTDGGSTWYQVSLNGYTPLCISFYSVDSGYIGCANGVLLKTVNGGNNWLPISNNLNQPFESLFFYNSSIGFSFLGPNLPFPAFKTTNGGLNWTSLNFTIYSAFHSWFFVNELTGFISTSNSEVRKTTNGGINWQISNVGSILINIYFKNSNTGFVVGVGGQIFRTLNQGYNWQCVSSVNGVLPSLNAIHFTSSSTGYIIADGGVFLKSTNMGNSWNLFTFTSKYKLKHMCFLNNETGYVTNQSNLLKTTNGGLDWDSLSLGAYSNPNDVYFKDLNTGYVAGNGIFRTTNGGLNWTIFNSAPFHSLNYIDSNLIYVVYSNHIVNHYSEIFKSTDGGIVWNSISGHLVDHYFNRVKFIGYQVAYAIEDSKVMKSSNSGINWFQVLDNGGKDLFFLNESTGYIPGYKTTNGGINWLQQETLNMGNSLINGMFFSNTNTGYMVGGYSGAILKTTDGGGPPVSLKSANEKFPEIISLSQNYPNPFNPVTKIIYDVPPSKGARGMMTKLIIYDILGREIETLVNESQKPGSYEVTWDGSRYASGVYFYRLYVNDASSPQANPLSITKKMVLIK